MSFRPTNKKLILPSHLIGGEESEFKTDRNFYVDLRQCYLAWKLKFVKGRGYDTYKSKEVKKEHKKDAKSDKATEDEVEEAPVPLVSLVHNVLHSVFSNVQVYINNQQTHNSKGLYAHKYYNSNNFKGAISEYKGVCISRFTTMKSFRMRI